MHHGSGRKPDRAHGARATSQALGVNRLSIGVQSFDDEVLRTLGRALPTIRAGPSEAALTRFENVSVDLMCGIPGRALASR